MSKTHPLVSIIIPTYNRRHLIVETLDSIIAQTYKNWECIVVDDGSTDNTNEVMEAYCKTHKGFQYHQRPNNKPKGANACRNYGYELSKGDYIQWFDSDDLMHRDTLKIKWKYALENNADIVIATHTTEKTINIPEIPVIECFESATFYIDYILGKKPVITNDVYIKKEVIKNHRFDENLHKAQEYEFFTRLFEQKLRYCFIDIPLTIYRESENSISKQTSKGNVAQVESLIYLSKKMQQRHQDNPKIVERAKRQGRKMYKSLLKQKQIDLIFKHFTFFKKAHHKSSVVFLSYMLYNLITGRGFDRIKPKTK